MDSGFIGELALLEIAESGQLAEGFTDCLIQHIEREPLHAQIERFALDIALPVADSKLAESDRTVLAERGTKRHRPAAHTSVQRNLLEILGGNFGGFRIRVELP